ADNRAYFKRKQPARAPRCESYISISNFERPAASECALSHSILADFHVFCSAADVFAAGVARERGKDGQPASWREAFALYQLAFELGHAPAALKLGIAYVRGMNAVAVDY